MNDGYGIQYYSTRNYNLYMLNQIYLSRQIYLVKFITTVGGKFGKKKLRHGTNYLTKSRTAQPALLSRQEVSDLAIIFTHEHDIPRSLYFSTKYQVACNLRHTDMLLRCSGNGLRPNNGLYRIPNAFC